MNCRTLPDGYVKIDAIDLVKNRRQMLAVNIGALAIVAIMVALGIALIPFEPVKQLISAHVWVLLVTGIAYFAYIVAHEMVHGAVMYALSGVKPKFGVKLPMYAYAGSSACFDRRSYVLVALAPLVLCGALFVLLQAALPAGWAWLIYFLQIGNVSGAAGDIYCAFYILKKNRDILIIDSGTDMQIFAPTPRDV